VYLLVVASVATASPILCAVGDPGGQGGYLGDHLIVVHSLPVGVPALGAGLIPDSVDLVQGQAHGRDPPFGGLPISLVEVGVDGPFPQQHRHPVAHPGQLAEQPLLDLVPVDLDRAADHQVPLGLPLRDVLQDLG
jgi:hypothetical protein